MFSKLGRKIGAFRMFYLVRVFGPTLSSLISHKAIIIVGPSSPTCSGRMMLSKTAVTDRVKHASDGKGQYIYKTNFVLAMCIILVLMSLDNKD